VIPAYALFITNQKQPRKQFEQKHKLDFQRWLETKSERLDTA
jgi:hypothetical protein